MIRIKCGTCGTSKGYKTKADGAISLPAPEEARLVARGVAAYATMPIIGNTPDERTVPPSGDDETDDGKQGAPGNVSPAGAATPPSDSSEQDGGDQDTSSIDPPAEAATEGGEANADPAEVKRLERMSKDDLVQMAQDMGVDISGAKNNHERAVLIVSAGASDDGDVPPDLGVGDIVQ